MVVVRACQVQQGVYTLSKITKIGEKMSKSVVVLALLLIVCNVAAEDEISLKTVTGDTNVLIGPYLVNYTLGDLTYWGYVSNNATEVELFDGTIGLVYCAVFVFADESYIYLRFKEWPQPVYWDFYSDFNSYYKWADADGAFVREIDGKENNVLLVNRDHSDHDTYTISYPLENDGWVDEDGEFTANKYDDNHAKLFGENFVTIISEADWDITRQFLNSIHVEKVG